MWWGTAFKAGDFNLSHNQALSIFNRGLRLVGDLWNPQTKQIKTQKQLAAHFDLTDQDRASVAALTTHADLYHRRYLDTSCSNLLQGSWIGGFLDENETDPAFLFQTSTSSDPPSLELDDIIQKPPLSTPVYTVGPRSKNLIRCETSKIRQTIQHRPGFFCQIRVSQLDKHKSSKREFFVYFGLPCRLTGIDLAHWAWKNGTPFLMYSAKKGRELLVDRTQLKKPVADKWRRERQVRLCLN